MVLPRINNEHHGKDKLTLSNLSMSDSCNDDKLADTTQKTSISVSSKTNTIDNSVWRLSLSDREILAFPRKFKLFKYNNIHYEPVDHERFDTRMVPIRLINDLNTHCWFTSALVALIHARRATNSAAAPQLPNRPTFQDGFELAFSYWCLLPNSFILNS